MTTAARTMRLGGERYPLVLPDIRDPRLHLAAVIVTIHILGQTTLGFRVSIPQILVSIITCAVLEVAWTFFTRREVSWPASAMLTGSGVALILRLVGMGRDTPWSWRGWHLYALVAGVSLVSKYAIRHHGSHVFNPSNLGLVAAFVLLGSNVIEPLDFWWGPLSPGLVAAYAVIVAGGLLITARLRLLSLAAIYWLTLAAGLGILSVSGHCITAAWAVGPVCGFDFWSVVMTSPELLIFLFFMITDPKTVPAQGRARIPFAIALAIACTLLMAGARTEFGAKVGLLAGLVVLTPTRFWLDGRVGKLTSALTSTRRSFAVGAGLGAGLVAVALSVVAAGTPARDQASGPTPTAIAVALDPAGLPPVSMSAEAAALNSDVASDPAQLAIALAEALAIENEAMRASDTSLLRAVTVGERLIATERKIEAATANGIRPLAEYAFEALRLEVLYTAGPQGGAHLAMVASGERTEVELDASGVELTRSTKPFSSTFLLAPGADGRWLLADEIEGSSS